MATISIELTEDCVLRMSTPGSENDRNCSGLPKHWRFVMECKDQLPTERQLSDFTRDGQHVRINSFLGMLKSWLYKKIERGMVQKNWFRIKEAFNVLFNQHRKSQVAQLATI